MLFLPKAQECFAPHKQLEVAPSGLLCLARLELMTLEIFSKSWAPGFPAVYSWEASVGDNRSTGYNLPFLNHKTFQNHNILQIPAVLQHL